MTTKKSAGKSTVGAQVRGQPRGEKPRGKKASRKAPRTEISTLPTGALSALAFWFERQQRVLPWREEPSPYRVWISEIMLQQTQVITVIPFFERFVSLFPTVEKLASAPEDEVLKAWAGLGYYSRARNLHRGAKQIVATGRFPRTREEWLEIPGVGEYTAGAVCSIALNQPEALVDGNVERVFSRLVRLSRKKGETAYKESLWEIARDSVKRAHTRGIAPSVLNQAWMELGALICSPRNPKCDRCPVRKDCAAFTADEVVLYPEKKKPKEWLLIQEKRVAVLSADGESVALARAAEGEWRAGLWDFPAASPKGWKLERLGELTSKHVVTRHKITRVTEVYRARSSAKVPALQWVSLREPEVALGSAPKKVMQFLTERFSGLLL